MRIAIRNNILDPINDNLVSHTPKIDKVADSFLIIVKLGILLLNKISA